VRRRVLIALALIASASAAPAAAQEQREPLDIRVFAKIGPPGQPEPVAIGPDDRVYVGTNQLGHGDRDAPSKVFAFGLDGTLVREYVVEGQPLEQNHGIQGLAFDANGLLYALDRSADPRVLVLDPATGEQRRYASFRDVPPCSGPPDGTCSATRLDGPAGPDYSTFAPNGDLFVTDVDQGLIWKVPKGGGDAQVWLTDPRMESLYGPNGIQFMADERTLLFANTASNPGAGNATTGRLYTVPVNPDGTPGEMRQVWESRPLDAPDGIAIARSGNVYVALAGANQVLKLGPDYKELARAPRDPAANEREEVPLDGPGSLAFLGDRLLVSNHSPIRGDEDSWAILDVFAGEAGLPLHHPLIEPPRLRLDARWVASKSRRRLRVRARVTRTLASSVLPVDGVTVRGPGRARGRTNAEGVATLRVSRRVRRPFAVRAAKAGFAGAQDPVGVR
jgi:SMP-30/Gluconolactonase/LRE-like region